MAKSSITVGEWTDALRSGDYKQGTGLLRSSDNEFCCLGVLCDLIDPDQWSSETEEDGFGIKYFSWEKDGKNAELPPTKIQSQIDILFGATWSDHPGYQSVDEDGVWDDWPDLSIEITEINDTGHQFPEIADIIEERYSRDHKIEI